MTTILVTGGCGFIGSWLIRELLTRNESDSVINLDALTYAGNPDNLNDITSNPKLNSRYRFVQGDIGDANLVNSLMAQADTCIHVAAETHVDRSITGPVAFTQTNVMGTHTLLEAARLNNLKKFVLVSTDEVYVSLALESGELFTETTPLDPTSPYACSKAAADLLALGYVKTYGMPVCITRCGNNYGPYQYPEKLIPFFILKGLKGESLPVYGDGLNVRDWIYVQDHALGILAVLDKGQPGEVYNIGARNQRNNLDITHRLMEQLGLRPDQLTYVKDRPGHDRRYALNVDKIMTSLNWSPKTSFEEGLRQTIAWYQANPEWIQGVVKRQQQDKIAPGAQWLDTQTKSPATAGSH